VKHTLDQALAATGVDHVRVRHRPRLLSNNGPAHVSGEIRGEPPSDAGGDRALAPQDEERGQAPALPLALGAVKDHSKLSVAMGAQGAGPLREDS
jgi:hypothetical protein